MQYKLSSYTAPNNHRYYEKLVPFFVSRDLLWIIDLQIPLVLSNSLCGGRLWSVLLIGYGIMQYVIWLIRKKFVVHFYSVFNGNAMYISVRWLKNGQIIDVYQSLYIGQVLCLTDRPPYYVHLQSDNPYCIRTKMDRSSLMSISVLHCSAVWQIINRPIILTCLKKSQVMCGIVWNS